MANEILSDERLKANPEKPPADENAFKTRQDAEAQRQKEVAAQVAKEAAERAARLGTPKSSEENRRFESQKRARAQSCMTFGEPKI